MKDCYIGPLTSVKECTGLRDVLPFQYNVRPENTDRALERYFQGEKEAWALIIGGEIYSYHSRRDSFPSTVLSLREFYERLYGTQPTMEGIG